VSCAMHATSHQPPATSALKPHKLLVQSQTAAPHGSPGSRQPAVETLCPLPLFGLIYRTSGSCSSAGLALGDIWMAEAPVRRTQNGAAAAALIPQISEVARRAPPPPLLTQGRKVIAWLALARACACRCLFCLAAKCSSPSTFLRRYAVRCMRFE
jgi:hypothetical protein